MAVFTLEEASSISKEVDLGGGGKYIQPSKINGEIRLRMFGEGITGYETWVVDTKEDGTEQQKPVRWEQKPAELPSNVRKNDEGKAQLKRFCAAIVWDYQAEDFKILSLTQKTLIKQLMGYIADDKDWGDPAGYDLKISKKGEGLKTEYTMTPASKKAPTKELQEAFEGLVCDLSKLYDGSDPFEDQL